MKALASVFLVGGLALPSALRGDVVVDDRLPAGNVVCEGVEGDVVRVRQDLRDTKGPWFYWAFRVTGAAGRTLRFEFTDKTTGGGPVGVRGPVVTTDCGKSYSYPLDGKTKTDSFAWTFAPDQDEVWFYECHPYLPEDWRAFLDAHAADLGKVFETGVLCLTKKGREVPNARFGCLRGEPKYRILMTSRHHCSETMATFVLEGTCAAFFGRDELGEWLRKNVELMVVPFIDYDGSVDGDQGKNRAPHDHNRDYGSWLHRETKAMTEWVREHAGNRLDAYVDLHCPWIRGLYNEFLYMPGKSPVFPYINPGAEFRFSRLLERIQCGSMRYRASDDLPFGKAWNTNTNYSQGLTCIQWAASNLPSLRLCRTFEVPFANANGAVVTPESCRELGRDLARAYREFFDGEPECIDGIYPHLAMFNGEGECGTGAVVPWAGSLWAVTYGPHLPVGSSDKLYEITPDLRQIVRPESIGGTPANRMIHRETNQLLIGPYVIDQKGKVRVVPYAKMPGRLTGAARHLADPANKVYVATMETGLYELDMRSLAVKTLIRENGMNDGTIRKHLQAVSARGAPETVGARGAPETFGARPAPQLTWPQGWELAPRTRVPGYHAKGLASGFGRVFVANNGENSDEARRNPFVPSGVLAWWNRPGDDWSTIRRCQFTEVTTKDGIYGNEHPETNPVWSLGWDAKSVILAVTTNGADWVCYRLPKASHAYDGAHGWNTEWPRIRDIGEKDLLATMHGMFWRFPRDFSPANPNGIRPLSTYLKVIGDFCRWQGRVVFGCDDQAQCEFLGTRSLKKGAPKRDRSQSNLWFVKPEDLTTFGPPSGEGWVWLKEDVKAGAVSDPFLHAGYDEMRFAFTDAAGRDVRHELLREGDWVRVKALEDAKGAAAHFRYGPKRPAKLPAYDGFVEVRDDDGAVYRFPNVNGDKTVICREVATERDLLYAGGVFYEVPADNAGGFRVLRPIALASEPVRSIEAKLGLVYVNGKPMAVDSLWKNGTAAEAYWLWESVNGR